MIRLLTTLTFLLILFCGYTSQQDNPILLPQNNSTKYNIILKTNNNKPEESDSTAIPGEIDTLTIQKLNEPLKALTALYSAMGGTNCNEVTCDLTTALGLGKQGSDKHKKIILKYFPNDKVAKMVTDQDCYLRPSGASTFSDYEYLTITDLGDTVKVEYNLMLYDHGTINWTKGPDVYTFKDNKFLKVKRNLWTFADK